MSFEVSDADLSDVIVAIEGATKIDSVGSSTVYFCQSDSGEEFLVISTVEGAFAKIRVG